MPWNYDAMRSSDGTYTSTEQTYYRNYVETTSMGEVIRVKPRPVYTGTFRPTPLMRRYIDEVLESRRISYGEKSLNFEKEFAELHGCKYAILSNSGTSALQVALQSLKDLHGWPDGGGIIVPATTFVATANIVSHCRMVPILVDVKGDTFNIDMDQVEEVMQNRHREIYAVIPVHLLGQPADVSRLKDILSNRPKTKVIEDSCECMFVRHHGKPVGSLGDIGCFSTYVAHLIVTGVGGISTTNNPDYAGKMRSLVNHGLELKYLNVDDNYAPHPMLNRRFSFDARGFSYRITEFEAAIGLAQLGGHEEMLRIRKRNAELLTSGLEYINEHHHHPFEIPVTADGNEHAHMMYPIVLRPQDDINPDKEPLMRFLNDRQIETRDLLPLLNHPVYRWAGMSNYPVSQWLIESAFYVGCHQDMSMSDCHYILQCLEDYFHEKDDE